MAVATQVLRSEWTKIRSVRSTVWTMALALVVTVALSMLISAVSKNEFDDMSRQDKLEFDPTQISFAGIGLGQLALIVFGVLVVSNEYSTGMIRTSLAAVPQRFTFLFSKIAVATLLAFVVGLVISFLSFFAGQAMLGDHKAALGDSGVMRALLGSAIYMTLITVFAMGVTAMLRSPMLSLGILMPFFFLISNILGNVSATEKVGQYLPDQAGSRIMQVVETGDDAPYGPWGGIFIMALWVLAALVGGYISLKKRDA
ncbi:ABC transporter permease [Streptomyces zagrosensis]|uniref:ABC-2 type transport system permease protein n=1 Tax=Streptomyces zagrosensis TaxID=1042984 RepID=A0A7W9Q8V6_9ACTN|nr:ABC transporter permease [Streptomyces zagrosensis]MBB5935783.1 ABC-2 type transport system permease protein [Streptomyces zagrosensis]